jgi:hypothetical protein
MKSNRRFIYLVFCLMFLSTLSTPSTFANDSEPVDDDVIVDDTRGCPGTGYAYVAIEENQGGQRYWRTSDHYADGCIKNNRIKIKITSGCLTVRIRLLERYTNPPVTVGVFDYQTRCAMLNKPFQSFGDPILPGTRYWLEMSYKPHDLLIVRD